MSILGRKIACNFYICNVFLSKKKSDRFYCNIDILGIFVLPLSVIYVKTVQRHFAVAIEVYESVRGSSMILTGVIVCASYQPQEVV